MNRAGIVDDEVDAAELLHGLRHRGFDLFLVADVADNPESFPSYGFHLFAGGIDGARELRMRVFRLAQEDQIRAVLGEACGDGKPDSARGSRDECGEAS